MDPDPHVRHHSRADRRADPTGTTDRGDFQAGFPVETTGHG